MVAAAAAAAEMISRGILNGERILGMAPRNPYRQQHWCFHCHHWIDLRMMQRQQQQEQLLQGCFPDWHSFSLGWIALVAYSLGMSTLAHASGVAAQPPH